MSLEESRAQGKSLEFIQSCVKKLGKPDKITGPEALEALRITEGYEASPAPSVLGSFDLERISLPSEAVKKPADLSVVWGEDGHLAVEDFIRQQVLTEDEAHVRLKESGVERCYSDPLLRHRATFASFVKKLVNLGLVDLSLEKGKEEVELFCVKKKQNKLRLIVDCRRSNSWFKEPENVKLTSGDSLGRLELGEEDELFVCSADLQNAFYTMAMPPALRQYFCLRQVRASDLGLTTVGGVAVGKDTMVTPRMAVLPMGWAWALWWCQRTA